MPSESAIGSASSSYTSEVRAHRRPTVPSYFEMMGMQVLYNDGRMLSAVPDRAPWVLVGKAANPARMRKDDGPDVRRVRQVAGAAARCIRGDADRGTASEPDSRP